MSGLSPHAQLLLDYATQQAKTRGHRAVTPAHVALAVASRAAGTAKAELGDDLLNLAESVAATYPTAGSATLEVEAGTVAMLEKVRVAGDEWAVLKADLPALFASALHDAGLVDAPPEAQAAPAAAPITDPFDRFIEEFRIAASDVGLTAPPPSSEARAGRWRSEDRGEVAILDDLWSLFTWIAAADRAWHEAELEILHRFFEERLQPGMTLEPHGVRASEPPVSMVVDALAARDHQAAARYAGGLVHLGRLISSVDEAVSLDESHALDDLRTALRSLISQAPPNTLPLSAGGPGSPTAQRALEELDSLIGLEDVKREIRAFVDLNWINQLRRERGHPASPPTLHMAFLGNPGTGKTTVARLLGTILAGAGILPKGDFLEVDRTALVGQYVGSSGPKARDLILQARGGVLFIDEAYSLVPAEGYGGYEAEVISVLVQKMEELRHELVVIVAGYPHLMAHFFETNPGLASRFATHVRFPNYSCDELMAIFDRFCADERRTCTDEVRSKVRAILDAELDATDFGNARAVRNVFELLQRNQAARLSGLGELATDAELATFVADDVPTVVGDDPGRRGEYL